MAKENFFKFFANTKARWIGRSIISVLVEEFISQDREYYRQALEIGAIKVNQNIVEPCYNLKSGDCITHLVHLHEFDCPEIKILQDKDGLVVVDKPAGIPCHPVSRYQNYCVLNSLKIKNLRCLHRLDMLTSGVLFLARKECKVTLLNAEKTYIAKVEGIFPESMIVDEKILVLPGKSCISEKGKKSCTYFRNIKCNGVYSLVECNLKSGRSHQIRVHLQSIGFPIINDPLYNPKFKIEKTYEKCKANLKNLSESEAFAIKNCKGLDTTYKDERSFICLHAHKYVLNGRPYISDFPDWATLSF